MDQLSPGATKAPEILQNPTAKENGPRCGSRKQTKIQTTFWSVNISENPTKLEDMYLFRGNGSSSSSGKTVAVQVANSLRK